MIFMVVFNCVYKKKWLLSALMAVGLVSCNSSKIFTADVLVIGGGTGGTAAGIQSARLGVNTTIVEAGPWLGGMISSAGVSAIDGNHNLPSGIWNEFREKIYTVYGGPSKVETGWVSNTMFEPHVADSIFKAMAGAERNLSVLYNYSFYKLQKSGNKISKLFFIDKKTGNLKEFAAKTYIDATELGDVLKAAGVPYDIGLEAASLTGEKSGIQETNNIIQDLTYVGILKDFGNGADKTIPQPANYSDEEFDGATTNYYVDNTLPKPRVDAKKMLEYGKLPGNKYMLNWPLAGNDTYLNVIEMTPEQREKDLEKAKQTTLRFIYFIQTKLGYKNLGLADEFPTLDKLALIPYHREGRRAKGLVRFTMPYIEQPFDQKEALYRTGISVGDYPIDHHHKKNPAAPQHLEFHPVPSYNIPLGCLIPPNINNLVIAEKGISVSNVVNGTTRLQPVVLLTGQAAGVLAAESAKKNITVQDVDVRNVQKILINEKAYIMPYIDVKPSHPHFQAIQKIGATGILRGTGIPYKWANQTWFYPDSLVNATEFLKNIHEFEDIQNKLVVVPVGNLTISDAFDIIKRLKESKPFFDLSTLWKSVGLVDFNPNRFIRRYELSVLLDKLLDPFNKKINHKGHFIN